MDSKLFYHPMPAPHWAKAGEGSEKSSPQNQSGGRTMNAKKTEWHGQYPTTHWSQVFLAHLRSEFRADEAEVQDWFQDFVVRKVLKNRLLEHADRGRGRFRTFLLNALDNFVIEQYRRARRFCRSPKGGFVSIDELSVAEPGMAAVAGADPGDSAWAIEVLTEAARRTEVFYESKGQVNSWVAFDEGYAQPRVNETRGPSKADLARRLGFKSAKAVSNAITTVRRMFGNNIRAIVREYECLEGRGGIEAEIRDLKAILARSQ